MSSTEATFESVVLEGDVKWFGPQPLAALLEPIDDLHDNPANPNIGNVEEIAKSLLRFGQRKPVAATLDGMLVAGHHVRKACKLIGWTHVAVVRGEFATKKEANAYLLADNQLASLAQIDESQQLDMLEELGVENLEGTGFDIDSVEDLQAKVGTVPIVEPSKDWTRAEDDDSAAARAAQLAESQRNIQFVLMVPEDDAQDFSANIDMLAKHFGLTSRVQTIVRAVAEQAKQVRAE